MPEFHLSLPARDSGKALLANLDVTERDRFSSELPPLTNHVTDGRSGSDSDRNLDLFAALFENGDQR